MVDSARHISISTLGMGERTPVANDRSVSNFAGEQFGTVERTAPEAPKKSGGFKAFFNGIPKGMTSGLSKFTALIKERLPSALGGQGKAETRGLREARESESHEDHRPDPTGLNSGRASMDTVAIRGEEDTGATDRPRFERHHEINGVSHARLLENLRTIDSMTVGDHKLPFSIKQKMAQSPTLMDHLRKYEAEGFKLQLVTHKLGPGEEFDGTADKITLSLADAVDDPNAFIAKLAEALLKNEVKALNLGSTQHGMKTPALIQHQNETKELPKIMQELDDVGPIELSEDEREEIGAVVRDSFEAAHVTRNPANARTGDGTNLNDPDPFPDDETTLQPFEISNRPVSF